MIDEDSLNELLKPLNMVVVHGTSLRLYYERQALKWYIANSESTDVPVRCKIKNFGWTTAYAYSTKELFERVLAKAMKFCDVKNRLTTEVIDNPYFECKSLEEMLVKRDLMYA